MYTYLPILISCKSLLNFIYNWRKIWNILGILLSFSVFYLRCIVARHTIIKVSFTIKIIERVFAQVSIPPVLKVYYFLCSTYIFSLFFRKVENQVGTYCPNGYMIVFAVDDEDSLDEAEKTLSYLKKEEILQHQAVILVANKTDLVRSRLISTSSKFPLYLIHIYILYTMYIYLYEYDMCINLLKKVPYMKDSFRRWDLKSNVVIEFKLVQKSNLFRFIQTRF